MPKPVIAEFVNLAQGNEYDEITYKDAKGEHTKRLYAGMLRKFAAELQIGEKIEVGFNDKWFIIGLRGAAGKAQEIAKQAEKPLDTLDPRQSSIEMQSALKSACLLMATGKIDMKHPVAIKTIAQLDKMIPEVKA